VTERQNFHRKQSPTQTEENARSQIDTQEMWGGPFSNNAGGETLTVKAWRNELPQSNDLKTKRSGIEFTTEIEPDSDHPSFAYWSYRAAKPAQVREEDGYAKIKVKILFCNQVDPVYVAKDRSNPDG
jgi:hypothetical protein